MHPENYKSSWKLLSNPNENAEEKLSNTVNFVVEFEFTYRSDSELASRHEILSFPGLTHFSPARLYRS